MDLLETKVSEAFLEAPIVENGWQTALAGLASLTRSAFAQLLAIGDAETMRFNYLSSLPGPNWDKDFIEAGGGRADVNWRIACVQAPMTLVGEDSYAEARKTTRYDVYDDLVDYYDLPYGCQTVLYNNKGKFFGLAALRNRSDGNTTPHDRKVFGRMARSASNAIRMQIALEHQAMHLMTGVLESMNAAAFICDIHGKVGALTDAADLYLSTEGGLKLRNNELLATLPSENAKFKAALKRISEDLSKNSTAQIWISNSVSLLDGRLCQIFPLPQRIWSFGFDPRILIILRKPGAIHQPSDAILQSLLDLTPAEASVARHVANGLTREEIAKQRQTSVATVTAQLKNIFRKSDVQREVQLAVIVNKILQH